MIYSKLSYGTNEVFDICANIIILANSNYKLLWKYNSSACENLVVALCFS